MRAIYVPFFPGWWQEALAYQEQEHIACVQLNRTEALTGIKSKDASAFGWLGERAFKWWLDSIGINYIHAFTPDGHSQKYADFQIVDWDHCPELDLHAEVKMAGDHTDHPEYLILPEEQFINYKRDEAKKVRIDIYVGAKIVEDEIALCGWCWPCQLKPAKGFMRRETKNVGARVMRRAHRDLYPLDCLATCFGPPQD